MKGISSEVIIEMKDFINKSMEMVHFQIETTKKGKRTNTNVKLVEGEYTEINGSDLSLKVIVESTPQNLVNFTFIGKCMVYANSINKLFLFTVDCIYVYEIVGLGLALLKKTNIKWDSYCGFSIYQQHIVLHDINSIKYVINI